VSLSSLRLSAELAIASYVLRAVSVALTGVVAYRVLRRQNALTAQMTAPPAVDS